MTNLFKLLFSVFVLSATSLTLNAQMSITIEASQNITNFKFTNSDGEKDKNYSPNYSGGYALGFIYEMENLGLYFPAKVGMRKSGATYVYDESNYSWSLNYFEARIGAGYKYMFGKFGVQASVMGYYGYLLKANQTLNNEDFNIIDNGTLNRQDFGIFFSPGANFKANDLISIYLDVNYMLGLANLETDESQKSKNMMYGATLGLAFTIK